MNKLSTITIRLNEELKTNLQKDLDTLGISPNQYFILAAKQLVLQKRVPFELLTENKNSNTSAAIPLKQNNQPNELDKAKFLILNPIDNLYKLAEKAQISYPTIKRYKANLDSLENVPWKNIHNLAKLFEYYYGNKKIFSTNK